MKLRYFAYLKIGAVTLNPERDCVIKAHSGCNDIQRMAV